MTKEDLKKKIQNATLDESIDMFSKEIEKLKINHKELKDIDIASLANYQVCFDETNNLYDYCENISQNSQKKELRIYKYIKVSKLTWDDKFIENLDTDKALKVTSVVISYTKRYQKFEVEEIFTNYKIY